MVADEKSSFFHAIAANYHVVPKDAHVAAPLWGSKLEVAFLLLLVLTSIASATAGCLQCWTLPGPKRLPLLVIRTSNLVCAAAWGVLCWEQLSSFPDSMLTLAVCGLAATLHVVVICAQRGQCSFQQLPAYIKVRSHDKPLGQEQEQAEVMHNPLLIISRKSSPRSSGYTGSSPKCTDCDTSSLSECLIFDIDNMPGTVVVPKANASHEKVAKFYQSKLLCVTDDKSKDM